MYEGVAVRGLSKYSCILAVQTLQVPVEFVDNFGLDVDGVLGIYGPL
jgi:hypothetical protein